MLEAAKWLAEEAARHVVLQTENETERETRMR
jgi:hypothetical protein